MSIEEARREVSGHLAEHCRPDSHPQLRCCLPVIDAYAMAVLEEAESVALATADVAVNDHFIEDAIVPLRARINALGAPQRPPDGQEPPEQEGDA